MKYSFLIIIIICFYQDAFCQNKDELQMFPVLSESKKTDKVSTNPFDIYADSISEIIFSAWYFINKKPNKIKSISCYILLSKRGDICQLVENKTSSSKITLTPNEKGCFEFKNLKSPFCAGNGKRIKGLYMHVIIRNIILENGVEIENPSCKPSPYRDNETNFIFKKTPTVDSIHKSQMHLPVDRRDYLAVGNGYTDNYGHGFVFKVK